MAILKFSKFKKERRVIKEQKLKEAAYAKHTKLFNEKLAEFGVKNPAELSETDQIKFYDSLKPVMEAAEAANDSGKDVVELPKDGEEAIVDKGDNDGEEELGDDKGGAKVVAEGEAEEAEEADKGSAKTVADEVDGGDIEDNTKDEGKEESGDSGEAKEDQKGDEITPLKKEGDIGTDKETVNASGKVVESTIEEQLAEALAEIARLNEEKVKEGNAFSAARQQAIDDGKDEFEFEGETFKVTGDKDTPSMDSTSK
jgi:hypothetical protein